MYLKKLLFSFQGRIPRKDFIIGSIILSVVGGIATYILDEQYKITFGS